MNKVILQLSVKITGKGYKVRMFWRGLWPNSALYCVTLGTHCFELSGGIIHFALGEIFTTSFLSSRQ